MDYKSRIREKVLKSFTPMKIDEARIEYWKDNPGSVAAIEKVKQTYIDRAIDEYEKKHKLGEYKTKSKNKR